MSNRIPVLYRVCLKTREATGDVSPYCCEDCRESDRRALESTGHDLFYVAGHDSDVIPESQCEFCGSAIYQGEDG